jgi:alanyl-tRNA synthetase
MKTHRLYYQDAYQRSFSARLIEQSTHAGQPAVVLDQTAFYPTGGGQPHDLGWLGGVEVLDVVEREADGGVLHVLSTQIQVGELNGEIDWPRRFDHMQQHTGQHILSQAFARLIRAETIGFHLSGDTLTIDLDRGNLSLSLVEQVEDLANRLVFEDRPVTARFVTPDELERLPLRKPPKLEGDVRVVQVEGFDASACGGTHVSSTGQIGLIKITHLERRGAETRVEFHCGWRALADYRRKHEAISRAAAGLSIGYWELDEAVARLQTEAKEARKKQAEAEGKLMLVEADELAASVRGGEPFGVVARAWQGRDAPALRAVAKRIVDQPRTVALLGSGGSERCQLVFARSGDLDLDVSVWLRQAAQRLGGKGGGQADLAQGGSGPTSLEQVQAALDWVSGQMLKPEP